ncbi:Ferredoxin--NAD(P)(+) reductase (naphthalene dioxygenase/salicylate 5-hydroxylase ferredoxin-specific) [Pontiella desulfatans]|uniref:Ferredoxin--NAD(P)(+) reductase (Naphthalene dioxygenase/salicylate 5-hydroxylase ferredoxin-specific) n=1 Tax=Pontiella desulfatans TaxID=2750659 RepID=A0A6C2U1M2_PONDE|nr:FAD-dependent oxidoreductase [Pontiella desulfatans]VGO13709.1 Ferredoxin--NAD(P)(+) reductase (naphthalene dioxygenase/salicylate 5-hydroxylase ferredoxin-specific) [Pontiella desulfatans]
MLNLDYTEHAVLDVRMANDDLFELVLKRDGLEFSPGDCVAIYTDQEKSRPYSIASGPDEEELRFVVRSMDGGEVSPWLMRQRPGGSVRITPPFGWFRPGQDIGTADFAFIATGTGIAPFLSYMKSGARAPTQCLYGVRHETDSVGFGDLKAFCPTRLAVSREQSGHHFGRVTDLLDTLPLNEQVHYYCCGLESMVNDVSAWLQAKGIDLSRIHREVFFHG